MEGHAWRSIPTGGSELAAALAAETYEWPVGTVDGRGPEVLLGGRTVPTPSHQRSGRARGARLPFVAVIVAGLVLGTAGLAYAQTSALTDGSQRGVLESESFDGPTEPAPGAEPAEEDPAAGQVAEADLEPGALLDDIAGKLEPDAPERSQPDRERDRTDDAESSPEATDESTSGDGSLVAVSGRADADPGVVHLTFDDGPHPVYTPAVLDVLARHDAKATFFVLGSLAEAHPELLERIVAEGHTVANHTWNHDDLAPLDQAEFNETVLRTQAALGPHATPCLRPPFGSLGANTRSWAAELGLKLVLWDTDTLDWQKPGVDAIADSIVDGASGGSPILLHDAGGDRTQTVAALDRALTQLSDQGLRFEPIC